MGGKQIMGLCFAAVVSGFALAGEPQQNELNAKDLVNGYKLNLQKFKSMRVTWRYMHEKGEEWFRENEAAIIVHNKAIRECTSPTEKKSLKDSLAWFEEQAKYAKTITIMHFDFWTDRKGFQTRRVSEMEWGDKKIPRNFTFPDALADETTLATDFRDIPIISFNGNAELGFRGWFGVRGNKNAASVLAKAPESSQRWLFPPLGVESEDWGDVGGWHEIDRFFTLPIANMSVEGTDKIGDKEIYLLAHNKVDSELRHSLTPELLKKYQGKAKRYEKTVAWIDPSQGFLPLKIGYYYDFTFEQNAKPFSKGKNPGQLLEVEHIKQIPGGGYFPVKGVLRSFRHKMSMEKLIEQRFDLEGVIKGKYKVGPIGIFQETSWEAFKVDADWETTTGMFDLRFPTKTVYADRTKLKVMSTDDPSKAIDQTLEKMPPPVLPARSWGPRLIFIIVNIVLIGVLIVLYRFKRRQKGSS